MSSGESVKVPERKDACIHCKNRDYPCHDGRANLGKMDEPCESFERDEATYWNPLQYR